MLKKNFQPCRVTCPPKDTDTRRHETNVAVSKKTGHEYDTDTGHDFSCRVWHDTIASLAVIFGILNFLKKFKGKPDFYMLFAIGILHRILYILMKLVDVYTLFPGL